MRPWGKSFLAGFMLTAPFSEPEPKIPLRRKLREWVEAEAHNTLMEPGPTPATEEGRIYDGTSFGGVVLTAIWYDELFDDADEIEA